MGYKERSSKRRRGFLRLRDRGLHQGLRPVYIDECGFEPYATRRHGYARKGQRVYGLTSGHRRPRTSLIAARIDGHVQEPFLFEGTCDTEVFNFWLETRLCPRLNHEHLVILDNAAFHKSPPTARMVRHTGARLLFLPPYSPDFDPLEHDFAALKKNREFNENPSIDEIIRMYK